MSTAFFLLFRVQKFVCNGSCEGTFQTCFKCGRRGNYCSRTPCQSHPFSKHPKGGVRGVEAECPPGSFLARPQSTLPMQTLFCSNHKNSRRLELPISKNTPHGRWGQGPGSVDPRFPAGLPFPVPEILDFAAFRDSGKVFQQFSRDFPGVFPENPRTDPRNSHSLLEFSDPSFAQTHIHTTHTHTHSLSLDIHTHSLSPSVAHHCCHGCQTNACIVLVSIVTIVSAILIISFAVLHG